jgi:hypothetical protein
VLLWAEKKKGGFSIKRFSLLSEMTCQADARDARDFFLTLSDGKKGFGGEIGFAND